MSEEQKQRLEELEAKYMDLTQPLTSAEFEEYLTLANLAIDLAMQAE